MEILAEENINPAFIRVNYSLRGWLFRRALEIRQELARGKAKPFSEVFEHIGNPQGMGQPPITFFRQVLGLLLCPDFLDDPSFPQDAKNRAKQILNGIPGHSISSYTPADGINIVRQDIAQFISQRDGYPAASDNIVLTSGGAEGIEVMMGIVQTGTNEGRGRAGVMLPVPGYSLYQARLLQHNSYQIHYHLDEESDWSLNVTELKRALEEARSYCVPRGLVLINPGNPTGQVLTYENIREVIKFCAREKLVLIADEVYQENVYADGAQFHSCKKVLRDLGTEYRDFQLMSLHSGAKGYSGECGLRGGYIELVGLSDQVKSRIKMYLSARNCSSTIGQLFEKWKQYECLSEYLQKLAFLPRLYGVIMGLVCNPPSPGDESYERFSKGKYFGYYFDCCGAMAMKARAKSIGLLFKEAIEQIKDGVERRTIQDSYKKRAKLATEVLNSMEGVKCNEIQGAMYAFPRITIPQRAIEEAKVQGIPPDEFYCWQVLEKTGSYMIPGCAFDMNGSGNHYYFRITIIVPENKFFPMLERLKTFHQDFMTKYKDT